MKTFSELSAALANGGRVVAARKAAAPHSEKAKDGATSSSTSTRWKALPNEKKEDKDDVLAMDLVRQLAKLGYPVLAMAEAITPAAPVAREAKPAAVAASK